MASVINTNIAATRTYNVYNRNNDYMNAAMTRVATGMKINSAKDGASVWAISERMRERIRANDQANQNIQNDAAMLKTAQGGVSNTIDILTTLKERAIDASNDSNLNSDRGTIATEVFQLVSQIDDNAAKVKFNGRVLLNGDYDSTVGTLNGVAAATSSAITEPEAAEFDSTVDPGSNAVLQHETNALKYDNSGTSTAVGANDVAVTALQDAKGNSLGIQAGDLIKFSWEENGEAKQQIFQVANSTTLSDLAFETDGLKLTYTTSAADLSDAEGTDVKKADGTTAVSSIAGGFNAVGTGDTQITNFKVAVTYDDNGTETSRVEAQEALKFEGVQQAKAPITGSNSVYRIDQIWGSSNAEATTATTLNAAFFNGNGTTAVGATTFKVKVDGEESEVTLAASDTIAKLQTEFAKLGINVQLAGKDDEILDSKGNKVTQDTLNGAENLKADVTVTGGATTSNKALYFVADSGKTIESITTANTNVGTIEKVQELASEDSTTASGSSTDLVFYVGGEANFGMNVSIKSMNMNSLFGTDVESFSKMFLNKDLLEKGDGTNSVIAMIDNALTTAMNEQTKLGAIENRLGYTSDNIVTMNENLEAADSVMRDADIAKEMVDYMKFAVLGQASQYMLAQSAQNGYQVLNLLQQ